jgi:TolB-like protein/class 3 adenylate cyclase
MPSSQNSRVLTLVFTDLADSTALKTARGDVAVGELIGRHREHVTRLAGECAGRIIDWAGDGCFLTFETSSAAVIFGLKLQETHHWETNLPRVRIGIHVGEVTEKPFNGSVRIEGLIVDLTARIGGLARPGQVLISGAVHQSARQRIGENELGKPIRWETYGLYTVKGFDEPVDVREAGLERISPFSAPAASEKAWPAGADKASTGKLEIRKIAVLPFTNISDNPEQEWFVDGMTETLIAELAKIKALTVISRTSVMHYKKTVKPLREIARDLGVQALVEGSVMRAGNRVRITAQLIDADTDAHLWAERYDGTMEEILDLQSDVALAIAKQVNVALTPEEAAPLKQSRTVNPAAFDALMKSKYALGSPSAESFQDALRHLHNALSIDPEYAEAHAFLAVIYAQHLVFGTVGTADAYFRARIAAQEAIRLGGESTTALWALADMARAVEWDWDRALEYAMRAAALSPSDPEVMSVVGAACVFKGHFAEAYRHLDRAIEANPLDPRVYFTKQFSLVAERRFDDAIAFNADAVRHLGKFPFLLPNLIAAHLNKGEMAEARKIADEHASMEDKMPMFASLEYLSLVGICYALAGDTKGAETLLETLRARHHKDGAEPPSGLGFITLALGRMDEAYPLLERSYRARNFMFLWFNLTHIFELLPFPLDERIKRLLARMKIASSPW